jgi:hypothetical protein
MEQKLNDAALMGAPIKPRREECAPSMEQWLKGNCAVVKDARDKLRREECALSMGQKLNTNDAVLTDAQIKHRTEEYASSMEQKLNVAAVKDAQIKLRREECARGMVHTAILMKNQLLLHPVLGPNSKRLLLLTPLSVLQQAQRGTVSCLEW